MSACMTVPVTPLYRGSDPWYAYLRSKTKHTRTQKVWQVSDSKNKNKQKKNTLFYEFFYIGACTRVLNGHNARQITDPLLPWSRTFRADMFLICMIWYDTAHAAEWEPYNLHDLGHLSWVWSVLHRSCTALNMSVSRHRDDLDRDLLYLIYPSKLWNLKLERGKQRVGKKKKKVTTTARSER